VGESEVSSKFDHPVATTIFWSGTSPSSLRSNMARDMKHVCARCQASSAVELRPSLFLDVTRCRLACLPFKMGPIAWTETSVTSCLTRARNIRKQRRPQNMYNCDMPLGKGVVLIIPNPVVITHRTSRSANEICV